DALKLTPFYNAFKITANVPKIYMQEFWATISIHYTSLHFKMNGKSHTLNLENFRDMLQICPKLPGQKFEDPPFEEEIISFIRDLGHTREIKEYYTVASGAKPPKAKTKYKKKADESVTSPKSKTASASKVKGFDEQQQKSSGTDEGTGTILGVLDVPPYESDSDKESWEDSEDDEDDNDDDGHNDDDDNNDDDGESDDHNDESDDEQTESDGDEIPDPNLTNVDQIKYEEEDVDEGDGEMIGVNPKGSVQLNVSQESGFEQEEEDAHVTLTPVFDVEKVDEPV
nr:hypothetical protein [Tanacetum cinerariifolium]